MKTMKYLSMMLMMLALSVCVVSCGDDEENINLDEIGNFYIEYNAQGGGLNAADLNSIKSQLASEYGSYLNGVETKQAIYVFQELVKQIRDDFSGGVSFGGAAISGTLDIKLTLKTEEGKTVKTGVVHRTKDGSSYEL